MAAKDKRYSRIGGVQDQPTNDNLDNIYALLGEFGERLDRIASDQAGGGVSLVNNSGSALLAGQIYGYSSGLISLADATAASFKRGAFVVEKSIPSGNRFFPRSFGTALVSVEGTSFTQGGLLYLATTAGLATATPPSGSNFVQIIGLAGASNATSDGKLEAILLMSLSVSSDL